ncbi:MAG: rod shape-determining protein MreC [Fusobacteriaceae bacterium]
MQFGKSWLGKKRVAVAGGIIFLVFCYVLKAQLFLLSSAINKTFFGLQSSVYNLGDKTEKFYDTIFRGEEIITRNKILREKNLVLQLQNYNYRAAQNENTKLKKLLGMKEQKKEVFVASVNFRQQLDGYEKFYVNKGSKDGIKPDMIAMVGVNLVGKVKEVHENYSMVEFLTSTNISLSVKTNNGVIGMIQNSTVKKNKLEFLPMLGEKEVNKNDELYTSGISDIYPEGLYVGKIIKEDMLEIYIVESGIKITDFNEVILLPKGVEI